MFARPRPGWPLSGLSGVGRGARRHERFERACFGALGWWALRRRGVPRDPAALLLGPDLGSPLAEESEHFGSSGVGIAPAEVSVTRRVSSVWLV